MAYAVVLSSSVVGADQPRPWPAFSFVDFRDTVWVPVRDVLAGGQPYDVDGWLQRHPGSQEFPVYAPAILLLGLPLGLLPWPAAVTVWALVLAVTLLVLVAVSAAEAGRPTAGAFTALALAAVVLSPVGRIPWQIGQFGVVAATATALALRGGPAGPMAVAVALAMIKPQIALPLLVLLLVRDRWRDALRGLALVALLSLPVGILVVVRAGGLPQWLASVRANLASSAGSVHTRADRADSSRIDVVGLLQRMGLDPGVPVTIVVTLVVAGVCAWLARRCWVARRADPDAVGPRVAWWTAVAATMLLWTPNESYGFLVAVPAAVVTVSHLVHNWSSGPARAVADVACGLPVLVLFVHMRPVDEALGSGAWLWPVNTLAVVAGLMLTLWTARRPGGVDGPRSQPRTRLGA